MDDDQGGILDTIKTQAEALGSVLIHPIQDWNWLTDPAYVGPDLDGNESDADAALDENPQAPWSTLGSSLSDLLPSQTTLWFYIVAVIIILLLVAFIAREVAG